MTVNPRSDQDSIAYLATLQGIVAQCFSGWLFSLDAPTDSNTFETVPRNIAVEMALDGLFSGAKIQKSSYRLAMTLRAIAGFPLPLYQTARSTKWSRNSLTQRKTANLLSGHRLQCIVE